MTVFALPEAVECRAAELFERHLARAREWFPHELVPWSRGRNFDPGFRDAVGSPLPAAVASAVLVNLLTEDNLPHYFHVIASAFDEDSAMSAWTRRWAAEEQRHAIVLRDWVTVTRQLDPVMLERARMRQMTTGFRPGARAASLSDGFVYLTLQELATRISHRNTGQHLDDEAGIAIMNRVAVDENLHFLFYRDLVSCTIEQDPSEAVVAIERQLSGFEMPGSGIEGFAAHAAAIAGAGIYDFQVHYDQILVPVVLRHWSLESIEGLSAEAEQARERALTLIARYGRVAARIAQRRADALGVTSGAVD
ncbi:MAG: acyl-ACP desaturase [Acidimicrobiales bacterium]